MDKNYKRQVRFFKLFRSPISLILKLKFRFYSEKNPFINEPIIIISNHCTGVDPAFIACNFKNHLYYVAGEHVLRMGLSSKFIKNMFKPIIKHKGLTDAACIMGIMKTIKAGHNICLFAEGNTSFNGETCEIHPSTAKLIKTCASLGATMITHKFTGGFLTKPRWGDHFRKGKVTGSIIGTYSPEKLKSMSDKEIHSIIERDLYENAYATQEKLHIKYKGRNLAQRLEAALYICPNCKGISTLKSKGDYFFCECGLTVKYNEYGLFEGENPPFNNVLEWDRWQESELKVLSSTKSNTPIFSDNQIQLLSVSPTHETNLIAYGELSLCSNKITLGDWEIRISKIADLAIHSRESLVFSVGKDYFEIKSKNFFCARKYYSIYKYLKKES